MNWLKKGLKIRPLFGIRLNGYITTHQVPGMLKVWLPCGSRPDRGWEGKEVLDAF